jgi:hypothetical protein
MGERTNQGRAPWHPPEADSSVTAGEAHGARRKQSVLRTAGGNHLAGGLGYAR